MMPECQRCGRCCSEIYLSSPLSEIRDRLDTTANVDEADLYILENAWIEYEKWSDGVPKYRCSLLYYNAESDEFGCRVQDDKPQICKDYEPGFTELCPIYEDNQ